MTIVIFLGFVAGLGSLGLVASLRPKRLPLESLAVAMSRPVETRPTPAPTDLSRIGRSAADWVQAQPFTTWPSWTNVAQSLAITSTPLDQLASQVLIGAGLGLMGSPIAWLGLQEVGLSLPVSALVILTPLTTLGGVLLPAAALHRRARERRRHFRVVVGCFVDLVVLELAGGTGIEGALFAASQASPDWAAQRMARSLLTARDSGASSWSALAALGKEVGVPELVELSTSLQLAGTEGARIRQSLQARAASLRRHEQADEESAANAMTERLFVPGALLLIGFLCFVGYPALTRILSGF
jgi:Flp pilus assembly protein TadB